MIHTSLSPNAEADDLWLVLKQLLLPWNWFSWKGGKDTRKFEQAFQQYLGVKHAVSFQRGRDALFQLLQALNVGKGHEVILQAYTCIVVPNAIQFTGAKPVYADIEVNGFNIDPNSIEERITSKTKAIIIQHAFGQAADLERIQAICKERKITLIEDCAHALSGSFQGKKLGTFGDAAIWSFGRDKIISSVWGGMVTTNSEALTEKLRSAQHRLAYPSLLQIKQALLHPLLFALIKPLYRLKLGRLMLFLFQKAKLIPLVIFPEEKKGQCPDFMPQRLPNVLAKLALHQLKKLDRFHGHRRHCAEFYHQHLQNVPGLVLPQPDPNSAWLRYTIRCADADRLLKAARKKGIYLGDWYRSALAPEGCELGDFQYKPGSCPRAEKAARETINLPTHVQMDERRLQQVVDFVKTSCGDPRDSVI